jgi:ATP-dependent Clp protease adapter protein ClpS
MSYFSLLFFLCLFVAQSPVAALIVPSGLLLRRSQKSGTAVYSTVIAPPKVDKKSGTKTTKSAPAVPDFLFKESRDVQKEFEEYCNQNKYILILYNDPVNRRQYVQNCLMAVLSFTEPVAQDVMLQAHTYGFAVAGEFSKDIAIDYAKRLVEMGLVAEAKPAADDDEAA